MREGRDKSKVMKEVFLCGHQPVRQQDVLLLRIVYNLLLIYGTNISYLWHAWLDLFMTCRVCLNNEFIIYWRQISGKVTSHYYYCICNRTKSSEEQTWSKPINRASFPDYIYQLINHSSGEKQCLLCFEMKTVKTALCQPMRLHIVYFIQPA